MAGIYYKAVIQTGDVNVIAPPNFQITYIFYCMGQRANLAIGNAKDYQLFYNHWCANTLPQELFWGPSHALKFISQQQMVDRNEGWLDMTWAEGGAVIDTSTKTLLLYGGEDLLFNVPLRRVYLELLKTVWGDWSVRWAFEGIVEIAEYLEVDRKKIIVDSINRTDHAFALHPPRQPDWLNCVCTVRAKDGVGVYPLDGELTDYLLTGPKIINLSSDIESLPTLNISDWTNEFPQSGFHIDATQKKLFFWTANDAPNLVNEVSDVWLGWSVNWQYDRFESQIKLSGTSLIMDQLPRATLIADAVNLLDRDSVPFDMLGLAKRISEQHNGQHVHVNPSAIRDDRLSFNAKRRSEILAECIAKIEGSRNFSVH